ncbi:MAG: hypothetical protein MRJ67_11315 [Nitrospirales bacterium]|nr:hypothetical protein [Nitrospirales bacterium]
MTVISTRTPFLEGEPFLLTEIHGQISRLTFPCIYLGLFPSDVFRSSIYDTLPRQGFDSFRAISFMSDNYTGKNQTSSQKHIPNRFKRLMELGADGVFDVFGNTVMKGMNGSFG